MFTGIINFSGRVAKRTENQLHVHAKVRLPKVGASIAINGVCLTVVASRAGVHRFDVGPTTWARTSLGALAEGARVNVEPSLRVGDEIGGHFVTGHVDAAGEILSFERWGTDFWRLKVALPPELRGLVAAKGSIAVDGISLTVADLRAKSFDVMIIPHTRENTNLRDKKAGDLVNLEADPLARYSRRAR
jgi:riboflavin synthase